MATAGMTLPEVTVICVGMPGIEKPKDESTIKRMFADFNLTDNVLVTSEAHIVLAAGVTVGYGVAVLGGENSLALAIGHSGERVRAGGWGFLLGEEGSAYWVGVEAVKAVLAAADGRDDETALTEMIATEWKIPANRPDQLAQRVYKLANGLGTGGNKAQLEDTLETFRRQVGALASLVERAAAKNDGVAINILERAADYMANAVIAAAERAGLSTGTDPLQKAALQVLKTDGRVPLAFGGSLLLSNQGELRDRLYTRLENSFREPALVQEPAQGALRLAMQA
jgi:N-acetylglucosamine kinase-like BadF-type ATPase